MLVRWTTHSTAARTKHHWMRGSLHWRSWTSPSKCAGSPIRGPGYCRCPAGCLMLSGSSSGTLVSRWRRVAARLGRQLSNVSSHLRELVALGLVTRARDASDKRYVALHPTPESVRIKTLLEGGVGRRPGVGSRAARAPAVGLAPGPARVGVFVLRTSSSRAFVLRPVRSLWPRRCCG